MVSVEDHFWLRQRSWRVVERQLTFLPPISFLRLKELDRRTYC